MYTSPLPLATLALASTILAHPTTNPILTPRQTTPQFQITALTELLPVGPPYGTSDTFAASIALTVSYSDPAGSDATLSTACSYTWPAGVTALNGTDWAGCQDAALQWRLPAAEFVGGTNFVVELLESVTAADG